MVTGEWPDHPDQWDGQTDFLPQCLPESRGASTVRWPDWYWQISNYQQLSGPAAERDVSLCFIYLPVYNTQFSLHDEQSVNVTFLCLHCYHCVCIAGTFQAVWTSQPELQLIRPRIWSCPSWTGKRQHLEGLRYLSQHYGTLKKPSDYLTVVFPNWPIGKP